MFILVICTALQIFRLQQSRRVRCAGHVAYLAERRDTYMALVGIPEGMRPLGNLDVDANIK